MRRKKSVIPFSSKDMLGSQGILLLQKKLITLEAYLCSTSRKLVAVRASNYGYQEKIGDVPQTQAAERKRDTITNGLPNKCNKRFFTAFISSANNSASLSASLQSS
eukprot:NODE_34_length_31639_cov_0.254375.p24 type:complete len:106 gc:universal NODE_34_length_31639_cov_0.254375:19965-19648(-)